MTVAGGGITWQIDREPSSEEQATRDLSSLANFTLLTEYIQINKISYTILFPVKQLRM
jgi:hypothetical protein